VNAAIDRVADDGVPDFAEMDADLVRAASQQLRFEQADRGLGIAPYVIEAVVNHVGAKAGVAGIYNKSEYLAEKKAALARWAVHLQGLVGGGSGNVVPMDKGRRR
jgi:hypothetical protein